MKKILINYIPLNFIELILSLRQFFDWWKKGFLENSPQLVKQNVFLKYGVKDAIWVETGTYLGTTTKYLSGLFPHVYSIEPEPSLFESARKRFDGQNVTLFNDVSEKVFSSLLPKLRAVSYTHLTLPTKA